MLTKYYLEIDGVEHELSQNCIKNWDEIKCAYKRTEYSGITRSFTSQFEFVNEAYDMLLNLYLRDGFNASATLSLYTITDRWEWEERFSAPIDFSTISWDNYILKVNCVDNSLAALINANKSTKYEFGIGSDITRDAVFDYERIEMIESATYELTQGETSEDSSDIFVTFSKGRLPWVGLVNSEVAVNRKIYFKDDQESEDDSYILKAYAPVTITFESKVEYRHTNNPSDVSLALKIRRNGVLLDGSIQVATLNSHPYMSIGSFSSPGDLPDADDYANTLVYAVVNGLVWVISYRGYVNTNGSSYYWVATNKTYDEFSRSTNITRRVFELQTGDEVVMTSSFSGNFDQTVCVNKSKFVFSWKAKDVEIEVDAFKPANVARLIANKMTDGKINVEVNISNFDERIANTYLLPSESIRNFNNAKIYSTWSEFVDWMSVVFGYVYYYGEKKPSRFKRIKECGEIEASPWASTGTKYEGSVNPENIVYISPKGRFYYHNNIVGVLYERWDGDEDYNDPETGFARTDTLFRITELSDTNLYYFDKFEGRYMNPILWLYPESTYLNPSQTIYFVHRSELMHVAEGKTVIDDCRDLVYSVDSNVIYSTVVIGYDVKEYDNINGRFEFNFNNTYTTGCKYSDKTLTLTSKYRADSYGIEFAAQKRGKDTTDSSADNDIFFVLCTENGGVLKADKSITIENVANNDMFNGAFSPMACVRANEGYICLQSNILNLAFSSSTGNTDAIIGGVPINENITLTNPIATSGTVDFTTDFIETPDNFNRLVEVSDNGILYKGFIKELDLKYAVNEAAKYKLIVKEIIKIII